MREIRGERNRAVAEADDAQDVRAERLGDGRGAGRLAETAEVAIVTSKNREIVETPARASIAVRCG